MPGTATTWPYFGMELNYGNFVRRRHYDCRIEKDLRNMYNCLTDLRWQRSSRDTVPSKSLSYPTKPLLIVHHLRASLSAEQISKSPITTRKVYHDIPFRRVPQPASYPRMSHSPQWMKSATPLPRTPSRSRSSNPLQSKKHPTMKNHITSRPHPQPPPHLRRHYYRARRH